MSPIKQNKSQKSKKAAQSKAVVPRTVVRSSTAPGARTDGNVFRVKRSELVGTISNLAVTGFAVTPNSYLMNGYDLCATARVMFPWLAGVAQRFERYRFDKVSIHLVSSQPTTATGRIYIGFEPDWQDPVPTTKEGLMGLAQATSASAFGDVHMDLDMKHINATLPWRYCNPVSSSVFEEPRMTYAGFFVFGIETPTANLSWDLWIDYVVELTEPTSELLAEAFSAVTTESVVPSSWSGSWWYSPTMSNLAGSSVRVVSTAARNIITGFTQSLAIELPKTGTIKYTEDMAKNGVAPATTANDYSPTSDLSVYDARGSFLGWVSTATAHVYRTVGAATGAGLAALGGSLRAQVSAAVADIYATFPLAAFVVPAVKFLAEPTYSARSSYVEWMP